MSSVVLRSGESQQDLLRRFRKQVMQAGVLRDARKKRFFISKSERQRIAKRKALRKERKRLLRERPRQR